MSPIEMFVEGKAPAPESHPRRGGRRSHLGPVRSRCRGKHLTLACWAAPPPPPPPPLPQPGPWSSSCPCAGGSQPWTRAVLRCLATSTADERRRRRKRPTTTTAEAASLRLPGRGYSTLGSRREEAKEEEEEAAAGGRAASLMHMHAHTPFAAAPPGDPADPLREFTDSPQLDNAT